MLPSPIGTHAKRTLHTTDSEVFHKTPTSTADSFPGQTILESLTCEKRRLLSSVDVPLYTRLRGSAAHSRDVSFQRQLEILRLVC